MVSGRLASIPLIRSLALGSVSGGWDVRHRRLMVEAILGLVE